MLILPNIKPSLACYFVFYTNCLKNLTSSGRPLEIRQRAAGLTAQV